MGLYNVNGGYGALTKLEPISGKYFFVAASTDPNYQTLQELWKVDAEGVQRFYNDIATALAATVSGRGDKILLSKAFTTAPSLTELATSDTNQVLIEQVGGKLLNDYVTTKATAALPATTSATLFTITGLVRILDIVGEVTTTIQAQACNVQLQHFPTVGPSKSICANADITGIVTGVGAFITGTLATALQTSLGGFVPQASAVAAQAGTIKLVTTATNTGSMKWMVRYIPLLPGARIF